MIAHPATMADGKVQVLGGIELLTGWVRRIDFCRINDGTESGGLHP
jgi:hypothetical protein